MAIMSVIAAIVTMLLFYSVNYSCYSYVTVYSIMAFISYPIAAYANLLINSPAVRIDLWEETPIALLGYIVGVVCIYLGAVAHARINRNKTKLNDGRNIVISVKFNAAMTAGIILVAILKIRLGLYFHASVTSFSGENAGYLNLLEHLTCLSYCGIYLQAYRYIITKSKNDLFFVLVYSLLPIIIYLPSGSRIQALGHLPLLVLFYLYFEKNIKAQIVALSLGVFLFVTLTVTVGIYRDMKGLADASSIEKYSMLQLAAGEAQLGNADPQSLLVGRMSDFVATGRIISKTPEWFPFKSIEGMDGWVQILLPGFFRPSEATVNFNDGAVETYKYGVTAGDWTSTPVMILGDLFARFGWWGIVFGMFMFGYILAALDLKMANQKIIFFIVFNVLFFRFVWMLYAGSLLASFSAFTRDMFLVYLVARLMTSLALKSSVRV